MWFFYVMLIILLLEAIFIFNKGITEKSKKFYSLLVFLQLFILSATRSINIGNDTKEYIRLFEAIVTLNNLQYFKTRYELGYLFFNKLVGYISLNPQILLAITSFIILGSFFWFINRNTKLIWLSTYLYITTGVFGFALSGLRQSIAISIILISYELIKKKRFFWFVLTVLAASFFHSSAIVFFLIYPLSKIKFEYKIVLLFFLISIVVFIKFDTFMFFVFKLFPKYFFYIDSIYFDGYVRVASVADTVGNFCILGLAIFFGYTKKGPNENSLLSYISLISLLVLFVSLNANLLDRISIYFSIFNIVLVTKTIERIVNKEVKVLMIFLVMVIAVLYSTAIMFYRPDWNRVFPYEFYWQVH